MSDYSELKRRAEALIEHANDSFYLPCSIAYERAANPATVLALIYENEKLRGPEETVVVCEKGKPFTFMSKDPCRYSLCEVTYAAPVRAMLAVRDEVMAENEALRVDAERYRGMKRLMLERIEQSEAEFDAEIDAKISSPENPS